MKSYEFLIDETSEGERIDKYLHLLMPEISRSYIQKLISDKYIRIHDKPVKASYKTSEGDLITVSLPDPVMPQICPEPIPLDIVFEDDDVLIVNKPKGMVVHPAPGHYSGTLVNALMYHCKDSLSGVNGILRPGIVHRIDKDTTGLLIVCKNDRAHRCIADQLAVHSITRAYRAVVYHNIKEDEGTVDAPIGRMDSDRKKMCINEKNGRHAVTHYRVLERFGNTTCIECRLETGRTHQIRVHMASLNHPLLGDTVYGPAKDPYKLDGQALHAMTLGFIHPSTGQYMSFEAPLPEYFTHLLQKLRSGR